ncbi:30S ribosomal protein S13 [Candidatus Woesearchaeota archaeon]|nr:30S ribosomal protein S13 [Candidatus Woesearchaeota archaeon]
METAKTANSANFRYIVRISNTDIDGNKKVADGIRKIKGVGFALANAICTLSKVNRHEKLGNLGEQEIAKLTETITKAGAALPEWMLNRRRNIETGESIHLVTTDLTFAQENDIRQMQRIRSYKGVRHMAGAPVRGQRTRSNFRKNKGKVQGVVKSKAAPSASDKGKSDDKGKSKK